MTILGIDPGTNRIGWGVVEESDTTTRFVDCGCVEFKSNTDRQANLDRLHASVRKLISQHQPDAVAVEKIFFFKNSKTVIGVSQSRGVILLAAAQTSTPVYEFTPLEVKQAVSSYGRAQKKEVQKMTRLILGLSFDPAPDDAADALAVAICAAHSMRPQDPPLHPPMADYVGQAPRLRSGQAISAGGDKSALTSDE